MAPRRKETEVTEVSSAEAAAPSPPPTEESEAKPPTIEELQRRLDEAEQRGQELFLRVQYAQAETENARKRAERDAAEAARIASERLVASLLPVLDALDAAAASSGPGAEKGVGLVRDDLLKVLREAGLEEVPTSGRFDPYLHEAVERVTEKTLEDGAIKEVVQKGYRFQLRLLRPAKVIVVRKGGET